MHLEDVVGVLIALGWREGVGDSVPGGVPGISFTHSAYLAFLASAIEIPNCEWPLVWNTQAPEYVWLCCAHPMTWTSEGICEPSAPFWFQIQQHL